MSVAIVKIMTNPVTAASEADRLIAKGFRVSVSENDQTVAVSIDGREVGGSPIEATSVWTILATDARLTVFAP